MAVAEFLPPPLLALSGVTKRFGGVCALDHVDFDLREGEIHALLGENGAGKSTLIKILGGIHAPDAGSMSIRGRSADIRGVSDANRFGIRLIHQELSLAPNLTVAENIFLGREPTHFGLLARRRLHEDAAQLVNSLGMAEIADVRQTVATLSVARQQLVEIARALSCRAQILVLDEPTSSLSEAETTELFVTLKRLRSQGVGIIYISHRLEEIMQLADRITVLRDGRSIGTRRADQVNTRELVKWMVGRDVMDYSHFRRGVPGDVAIEVHNLTNRHVHDVSFEVRYGEVLGIAGLVGSGRSELGRALFGIDRLDRGEIRIDRAAVKIRRPGQALAAGLVLVPEDRKAQGLVVAQATEFNIALPWVREWIWGPIPNLAARDAIVRNAIDRFRIRVSDATLPIDSLSGGNQQKALVGRWMHRPPKILVLDEPTRGVDVGAREEMFRIIGELAEAGMAIILISSDLDEVIQMSHRVAVYRDGTILTTLTSEQTSLEVIMRLLTGAGAE
jgi:ABC-type sugar transport system ATPase subunit